MPVTTSRPLDPKAYSNELEGSTAKHAALRAAGEAKEDDVTMSQRPCAKAHTSLSALLSLPVPPETINVPSWRQAAAAALLPGGHNEDASQSPACNSCHSHTLPSAGCVSRHNELSRGVALPLARRPPNIYNAPSWTAEAGAARQLGPLEATMRCHEQQEAATSMRSCHKSSNHLKVAAGFSSQSDASLSPSLSSPSLEASELLDSCSSSSSTRPKPPNMTIPVPRHANTCLSRATGASLPSETASCCHEATPLESMESSQTSER